MAGKTRVVEKMHEVYLWRVLEGLADEGRAVVDEHGGATGGGGELADGGALGAGIGDHRKAQSVAFEIAPPVGAGAVGKVGEKHHVGPLADRQQGLDGAVDRRHVEGAFGEENLDQLRHPGSLDGIVRASVADISVQSEAGGVEPQAAGRQEILEVAGEMHHHLVDIADDQGPSGEA